MDYTTRLVISEQIGLVFATSEQIGLVFATSEQIGLLG